MNEESSSTGDAGHGPSKGYSGMNKALKAFLEKHPATRKAQKEHRAFGLRLSGKKKQPRKKD